MASPDRGRTVVVGLGSPLMGDDGLGLVALERLRGLVSAEVELVDGGTWGLSLLPVVESSERLLLLDAIDADRPPGALVELEGEAVPRHFDVKFSTHDIDLRDVLALASLRDRSPAELVALGLQPDRVEMETGLSPVVESAMERLVDRALARLERWGCLAGAGDPAPCTR